MKKVYDIIITIVMITCVSLMLAKFFFPVSNIMIWVLALITTTLIIPKFFKDPKQYILMVLMWLFMTIIWSILATNEINEINGKIEVKKQQPIELIL